MNICIRTDSSTQIGTGHVMRCLTLADEIRQRGANISFICRSLQGNIIELIEKKGYKVYRLPHIEKAYSKIIQGVSHDQLLKVSTEVDAKQTKDVLLKENVIDWLIIDHYGIEASWESSMRQYVKKILIIDDLANRRHDCDILLDQNYNISSNRYNRLVSEPCMQLLGPEYALLRPQFRDARENLKERELGVKKILVSMGGSDPINETGKVLKALKLLNRDDIAVDVIVGSSNPHKEKIEQLCSTMPNAKFYCQVNNMAELMSAADIGIGASGTSTWERCCLGLPSIVMILADNQKEISEELDREGMVANLGWHEDVTEMDIRDAVENLVTDPEKRKKMSLKDKEMVDGNGATRVVEKMIFSIKAVSV